MSAHNLHVSLFLFPLKCIKILMTLLIFKTVFAQKYDHNMEQSLENGKIINYRIDLIYTFLVIVSAK